MAISMGEYVCVSVQAPPTGHSARGGAQKGVAWRDRQPDCLRPKPAGDTDNVPPAHGVVGLQCARALRRQPGTGIYAAFGGRCGGAVTADRDVTTRPGTAARAFTASTLAWLSTSSWSGKSPLSSISAWSLASGNVSGAPCCECALSSVVSAHCGAEEGTFKPDALIPTHKRKWKIRTAVRRRSMVWAL